MVQAESIISTKLHEAYAEGKVRDRDLEFGNMYNTPQDENPGHYSPYYPQQGQYGMNSQGGNRYPMPIPREVFHCL